MPAISIIIPIYKAENYLRRCLDSILKQSFSDYEVILVDDGSPDGSGVICDEYANKDARFHVIHKINGGLPSARSVGVENAKGEFSIQFDPDDWIEDNMLFLLYEKALEENADIVVCDMYRDYKSTTDIASHCNRPPNSDDLFNNFLTGEMPASFANKLIRHSLYKEKRIKFNLQLTRWEDTFIVCSLMEGVKKISFVDVPLYHYDLHSNSNSLIRNASLLGLKSQMFVCDFFMEKFKGTTHECAIRSMYLSTKDYAYVVLSSKDYIHLYEEYNPEILKKGLCGKNGISGIFMALTILTKSRIPQYLYKKLKSL